MTLMESGKIVEQKLSPNEVIVVISGIEESSSMSNQTGDSNGFAAFKSCSNSSTNNHPVKYPNAESKELPNLKPRIKLPPKMKSSFSPEITKFSPTLNYTPKIPEGSVTKRRLTPRSVYWKPKSRFFEPTHPSSSNFDQEGTQTEPEIFTHKNSSQNRSNYASTPKDYAKTGPITPKTQLMEPPGEGEDDDEDENDDRVYKTGNFIQYDVKRGKKMKFMDLIEWGVLVCLMVFLIASLTIHKLRDHRPWSLEIWKWCVLVLVIFCGRLFTKWLSNVLIFLFEMNFLFEKKVLYFIYGVKGSVRVFIWFGLVLLAWAMLINKGVERWRQTTKILNHITGGLASGLIGAAIWMVKTLLVKLLASSFHVNTFFDRIQESIFHQYVLRVLSEPPLMESAIKTGSSRKSGQLSFKKSKKGKPETEDVIDVNKLHKMKREKVSAWTMGGLVKVIMNSRLSTISEVIDESVANEEGIEQKDITFEFEAEAAAHNIFRNVAKPGVKFIEEEDLLRFMTLEEVDNMSPLFQGFVEIGKINKKSFKNWVVKVYHERKCLAYSLNDTKTAIEELNKILSGMILVIIIIVWLLVMGIATTNVLVLVSSQILLLGFVFGNTAHMIFDAIIFVFVMHPFDVGDKCVIDGVEMIVEEMNILTTIFLKYDNENIYYPNAVLATVPISNFNRSPQKCDSAVELHPKLRAL